MSVATLAGKRVLVVDDELLVALLIEDMLTDAGCIVVGPFSRIAPARAAALAEPLDAALMDVNVAGERIFQVAETLDERGIPFLLVTGYGQAALPPHHADWEVHTKPFHARMLLERLAAKIAETRSS